MLNFRAKEKNDCDVIREHHRFLWSEEDETDSWSAKLARRYWDKLFKEYCLIDLSRYKENKVPSITTIYSVQFGMRWRLEKEVVSGKGQFICANVVCNEADGLRSWEVNFGYREHNERRNALVKVRLCRTCSGKLNHHYRRREVIPAVEAIASGDSADTDTPGTEAKRARPEEPISATGSTGTTATVDQSTMWSGAEKAGVGSDGDQVKSREDEFAEYFTDMLL